MTEWKKIEDELPVGEKVDVLISFFNKITKKKYKERFWFYGKHASFADYDKSERKSGCIIFHPDDSYEATCVGDSTDTHNLVLTNWAYIDEPFEIKQGINKNIETKEYLEGEVKKLYPNLEYYNNFTTLWSDGWTVKGLFSYIYCKYADGTKKYRFFFFLRKDHKFPMLDKFNRTEDPKIILKIIKSIKELED